MQKVTDRVYQLLIAGFVNVYVIAAGDGVAIVDTGIGAGLVDTLKKELPVVGLSFNDIRHVLITHAHFDHVGGLVALQKALPTARTYAGRRDAPVIRGELPLRYADRKNLRGMDWLMSFMLAKASTPARVDQELADGDALDAVLPGLRVVELPGHSVGQVGFWWEQRKLLFAGDSMGTYPFIGVGMPFRAPSPDWDEAKRSVRKAANLGVDVLCPGHIRVLYAADAQIKALATGQGV